LRIARGGGSGRVLKTTEGRFNRWKRPNKSKKRGSKEWGKKKCALGCIGGRNRGDQTGRKTTMRKGDTQTGERHNWGEISGKGGGVHIEKSD